MGHSNELTIKGTRNGLVINFPDDGELADRLEQLKDRLQSTASFFRGGRVALHVGWRTLSVENIEIIGNMLSEHGVSLWSVISQSESTQRAAQSLGLETEIAQPEARAERRPAGGKETAAAGRADSVIFIQRTLRSGQKIEYPGHVVVFGDVNPGAEIVAGGNILVWGRLRGTVHAGALGNDEMVVCALSLFPTQLRIGNHIARSPETLPPRVKVPEMASVQNGEIVAEPWTGG
jgi:septum site-determining protein MinC